MLLTAVAFILYGQVFAQDSPLEERLMAQKTAFLTDKMELTQKEAEKFWPVYNDYSSRKEKFSMEAKTLLRYYVRNAANLNEAEVREILEKYAGFQQQENDLFTEYHKKFQEVIPASKVLKLYAAEGQFRQYLLNQIRENRQQRPGAR